MNHAASDLLDWFCDNDVSDSENHSTLLSVAYILHVELMSSTYDGFPEFVEFLQNLQRWLNVVEELLDSNVMESPVVEAYGRLKFEGTKLNYLLESAMAMQAAMRANPEDAVKCLKERVIL